MVDVPVHNRAVWGTAEIAAMLGYHSRNAILQHLRNSDGDPVKVGDIVEGDGSYLDVYGVRIPVHANVTKSGSLHVWAHEFRAAVETATGVPIS